MIYICTINNALHIQKISHKNTASSNYILESISPQKVCPQERHFGSKWSLLHKPKKNEMNLWHFDVVLLFLSVLIHLPVS